MDPHPETTESLVGLAPTLSLSSIVIHHPKCVSTTLSDSSDIMQYWEKPSCATATWKETSTYVWRLLLGFPTVNYSWAFFLVHPCGTIFSDHHQSLEVDQHVSPNKLAVRVVYSSVSSTTHQKLKRPSVSFDRARELTFCYALGSHSDDTCEKIYKALACCIK